MIIAQWMHESLGSLRDEMLQRCAGCVKQLYTANMSQFTVNLPI